MKFERQAFLVGEFSRSTALRAKKLCRAGKKGALSQKEERILQTCFFYEQLFLKTNLSVHIESFLT